MSKSRSDHKLPKLTNVRSLSNRSVLDFQRSSHNYRDQLAITEKKLLNVPAYIRFGSPRSILKF